MQQWHRATLCWPDWWLAGAHALRLAETGSRSAEPFGGGFWCWCLFRIAAADSIQRPRLVPATISNAAVIAPCIGCCLRVT
jgi:hypothetical protein